MCNNDEGSDDIVVAFFQKMDDFLAVFAVQAAGRFIGNVTAGAFIRAPADGDTLLLTSGQLVRQIMFLRSSGQESNRSFSRFWLTFALGTLCLEPLV